MYCSGAGSAADAATTIVCSIAPWASSVWTTWATVEFFWPIATYTQKTPLPFWLMIASSAIAVLPVWRSPMMSSRWPRPIGIIASIALMPVCIDSLTGMRSTTPGARRSTG